MNPYILVVDDDAEVRKLYSLMLTDEGAFVGEASNGVSGLQSVSDRQPDLIITDLGMPVMDGFEFISHLRQAPSTRGVPIIAVTGWPFAEVAEHARRVGCSAILAKIFATETLTSTVEAFVGGHRRAVRRGVFPQVVDPIVERRHTVDRRAHPSFRCEPSTPHSASQRPAAG